MPHNGINVPVFSLKTETSSGIGDFLDLIPLIDWVSQIGFDVIQILPLNDTGLDTSPYNIQSAFALNPLFIKWPGLSLSNDLAYVDYKSVRQRKNEAAKNCAYPLNEMRQFAEKFPWVKEYAQAKEGDKSLFEQYMAYTQMKAVKAHADSKGVQLLGDLPILIAPDSVDIHLHPEYFLRHLSAGAPPDVYSKEGQNWGFPLYNWENMEKDNFKWWRERLSYAAEFYHLYRIDHVVGFYRIWACQPGEKALYGKFIPENREEWIPQGEKILKMMLESTSMKPIGEDLGTIPDEVRVSLKRLGIPGTKVLRWEKEWQAKEHPFTPLSDYPTLSLTTVSTHDSTLLKVWWKTHPEEAKALATLFHFPWEPELSAPNLKAVLKASHHNPSLYHINLLPEYFSALPEFDQEVRINEPGVISPHNWSWRMKPTIEQMAQSSSLTSLMQECIH